MHRHCFRFLLGHLHVPGEIANNDHAKVLGVKEVYYGICARRELCETRNHCASLVVEAWVRILNNIPTLIKLHGFLITFCLAVSNMYMYEGRDYRETSSKDQEAFDNMMAGKVVILL